MKFFVIITFLVVLSGCGAVKELAEFLKWTFEMDREHFQDKMKSGFPELGIPSIDPVVFDPKKLEIRDDNVNVVLDLYEIKLEGLSKFNLDVVTPKLEQIRIKLELDHLLASGTYNVDGKVLNIFPIFGKGKYQVFTHNSYLQLTGEFHKENGVYTFKASDFEFDYEELELDFENFLGGKSVGRLVQRILPRFAKTILERVQPDIERVARPRVEKLVNDVIKKEEVQNALKLLIN